jgi:hypothetical protein
MAWIEIPLNNLRYRFRKLAWREEVSLSKAAKPTEDSRRTYLASALVEIAAPDDRVLMIGKIEDAREVLSAVPTPILYRLWILYRASLPPNLFFKTKGLYTAPEARVFKKVVLDAVSENEETGSTAIRAAEQKFGAKAVAENRKSRESCIRQ